MMVLVGNEGRWKYEEGTLELLIPSKPVFGARDREEVWSRLRCCEMVEALARVSDRVARDDGTAARMLLLSIGPLKAMRDAASKAIVLIVVNSGDGIKIVMSCTRAQKALSALSATTHSEKF
jgi:hypothetical protein